MTVTTSMVGGIVRRKEDPALIRGTATFTDDVKLAGQVYAAFVRSPHASARIKSIDASATLATPGVHAVYTGDDVRDIGPLPSTVNLAPRPLLADGVVRHVGEAVAMVVADDPAAARDAAEMVVADYEPLEAVIDVKDAATDRIKVHDSLDSNTIISWIAPFLDEDGQKEAKAKLEEIKATEGAVIISQEMVNQRLIPVAIEPRSVIADYNTGYDRFTIYSSSQIPHALAGAVAKAFGMKSNQVRAIAPEVGGGFGSKLNVYPDEMLVCFASRELGRPVKWTETRREAPSSTIHGRGWTGTATLVGTEDGEILGYELIALADMGAYTQNFTVATPLLGLPIGGGHYKAPTYWEVDCVLTNTQSTDAYRGAGRPEAVYYLERVVDMYAREIGVDAAEVRRKNFIPNEEFPGAINPVGWAVDTGDYATNLDALLELADYEGLRKMQAQARSEGRFIGIGLGAYSEWSGYGPSAFADVGFSWAEYGLPSSYNGSGLVRINPDGTATVVIGTGPSGQSHETTWAQIVSGQLGIAYDDIKVVHGDSHSGPGIGTFGSRSTAVDGSATYVATGRVREKAAEIAAHLLEASPGDIQFADGGAHVAGSPDQSVTWAEIATAAYQPHKLPEGMEGGLEANAIFDPPNATWPFGAHMAVVEVDPDTGDVQLLHYFAVDDCGVQINPMIVAGQLHGGITQGIGQAMLEEAVFDESGNVLTTSLIDYPIPTASDLPSFEMGSTVTPTDVNPMGAKGVGEAGTIGSSHTIVSAVMDALEPFGVTHIDMPLRPRKVWQAIEEARG